MNALDLFSAAAGGWSLGLHRAGFRTVAACEVVEWRRGLYSENNPGVPVYDDVCTLTAERLFADLGSLPDIIVGSPPCQDISSANTKGRGVDGEKSGLFFEAIRIIGEVRPRWFALENSDRVRTRGYDRIAAALEAHDYNCWPLVVGVGNAGGSHQRKRAWVIGLGTHTASPQGWSARQPRLDANTYGSDRPLPGADRGRRSGGTQEGRGTGHPLGSHAHSPELRIERSSGAGWQEDGQEAVVSGLSRVFRGPIGSSDLGSHIRAYAGVPSRLAEQCREAYGDAVSPQITEAIGRAILRAEEAMSALFAASPTLRADEEGR